jgi:hypothetical protein
MDAIKNLRPKFGRPIFLSVLYEKVKLATILLDNSKEYDLLMLSFDIGTDHQSVILNKILPMIKRGGSIGLLLGSDAIDGLRKTRRKKKVNACNRRNIYSPILSSTLRQSSIF